MRKISSRASLSKSAAPILNLADAVMELVTKGSKAANDAFSFVNPKVTGNADDLAEVVEELKKLKDDDLVVAVKAMQDRGIIVPDEVLKLLPKADETVGALSPGFRGAESLSAPPPSAVRSVADEVARTPITLAMNDMVEVFSTGNATEISTLIKKLKETNKINELDIVDIKKIRDSINSNPNITPKVNGELKGDIRDLDTAKWDAAKALGEKPVSLPVSPAANIAPSVSPSASAIPSSVDLAIDALDPKALSKVSKLIDDQESILDIGTILHLNKKIPNIAITEGVASKMLALYKSDPVKYIDDYSKLSPEARATLMRLESSADTSAKVDLMEIDRLIKSDVQNLMSPGAKEVGLSPGASPAKKAIRWGRVVAAVAAGLGGMALLNYVFSDDGAQEEGRREISKNRENTAPYGTSDSGYESSSLIMKEKGYLKSVQSSWTQEFDTAFRAFIDAGSANGAVPTDLVGGQSWSDVAGSLGFPPNKSGAFSAIRYLADLVGKKTSTPTTGVTTPAPSEDPASTTPVAAEDNPVLAAIIGAMYNQKLVGTPGFDLIREPKRIRALIESEPVGGPNPTGYGNAARIVMRMNPAIRGMLPAQLTRPVDEVFAKNPANKALLQAIQVAINGIYESAIPTLVKPGLERSRELIARYLSSTASGKWTVNTASNSVDQWVKLASERKMRIRAEIAAEMTPAEMAAARRIKMREI